MKTRIEHDLLGERDVSGYAGIHTARARENFTLSAERVPGPLIHALGEVKKACASANMELNYLDASTGAAIVQACEDVAKGLFDDEFDLDALQGGAGTSTNMCANEVIANRALALLGKEPGEYGVIHPLHHVNLHQSTNDVYPTALKVAGIRLVRELSAAAAELQNQLQKKEKEFDGIPTMGRTEWVDAVPITLGRQFSSFAEAISRDRWRTFKCEERLRVVNLGGTAVGNGLTAPRDYIFLAAEKLRQQTRLGLSRAENLMDATANADSFVEVSGMMKALSCNLIKVCRDLRLLHMTGEIRLPSLQAGSSIMPGKVNPVLLESVIQVGIKAKANDMIIADCAAMGTQQINEFMPLIATVFIETLLILKNACTALAAHVAEITADAEKCRSLMIDTPALMTAFLPLVGYEGATELVKKYMAQTELTIHDFLCLELGWETVDKILSPENLTALGHR
ncbi:MAG: lyase family protein [Lentisphaeria bacterium]|nr:lyase family protein [Lentisphaeria bacterium]